MTRYETQLYPTCITCWETFTHTHSHAFALSAPQAALVIVYSGVYFTILFSLCEVAWFPWSDHSSLNQNCNGALNEVWIRKDCNLICCTNLKWLCLFSWGRAIKKNKGGKNRLMSNICRRKKGVCGRACVSVCAQIASLLWCEYTF